MTSFIVEEIAIQRLTLSTCLFNIIRKGLKINIIEMQIFCVIAWIRVKVYA
jgi:hypothetical protein